jgi:hypothetical protein
MEKQLINLLEVKNVRYWGIMKYQTIKNFYNMYYYKDFEGDYKFRKILNNLIKNKDMNILTRNKRYYYIYKPNNNNNNNTNNDGKISFN